jgi:hypothetical protein
MGVKHGLLLREEHGWRVFVPRRNDNERGA